MGKLCSCRRLDLLIHILSLMKNMTSAERKLLTNFHNDGDSVDERQAKDVILN
jgi:hypothetical protein